MLTDILAKLEEEAEMGGETTDLLNQLDKELSNLIINKELAEVPDEINEMKNVLLEYEEQFV